MSPTRHSLQRRGASVGAQDALRTGVLTVVVMAVLAFNTRTRPRRCVTHSSYGARAGTGTLLGRAVR